MSFDVCLDRPFALSQGPHKSCRRMWSKEQTYKSAHDRHGQLQKQHRPSTISTIASDYRTPFPPCPPRVILDAVRSPTIGSPTLDFFHLSICSRAVSISFQSCRPVPLSSFPLYTTPCCIWLTYPCNSTPQYSYTQTQSSNTSGSKHPQLDSWRKTKETHEEVAVGKKSSRKTANTIVFLDNTGQRIEGGARGTGR